MNSSSILHPTAGSGGSYTAAGGCRGASFSGQPLPLQHHPRASPSPSPSLHPVTAAGFGSLSAAEAVAAAAAAGFPGSPHQLDALQQQQQAAWERQAQEAVRVQQMQQAVQQQASAFDFQQPASLSGAFGAGEISPAGYDETFTAQPRGGGGAGSGDGHGFAFSPQATSAPAVPTYSSPFGGYPSVQAAAASPSGPLAGWEGSPAVVEGGWGDGAPPRGGQPPVAGDWLWGGAAAAAAQFVGSTHRAGGEGLASRVCSVDRGALCIFCSALASLPDDQ